MFVKNPLAALVPREILNKMS